MFGIDDLAIAGLVATLAGSGMQMMQQQQNARNAARAAEDAIRNQMRFSEQAGDVAKERAMAMNTDDRQNTQDALANELYQEFITPVAASQQEAAERTATQGNVSSDYQRAKQASNENQLRIADNLANLFSRQMGAGALRRNEAYKNADAATQVGLLQNFSHGQSGVDKLRMQEAANKTGALGIGGQLVSGLGQIGMAGGFNGLFSDAASNAGKAASTLADSRLNKGLLDQTKRAMTGLIG